MDAKQLENTIFDLSTLIGETCSLYLCTTANSFQLGSIIFEAMEDEDDGYRSSLDYVMIRKIDQIRGGKLADVIVESRDTHEQFGWRLVDVKDKHIWLEIGTDNSDNYYPSFIFDWTPKESDELKQIKKLVK